MDDRFQRVSDLYKGVQDPCSSSMEALPFHDLERMLSRLWDDHCLERPSSLDPPTETLTNFLIKDKADYFQQVSSNIEETKKSFLQFYSRIFNKIDEMTQHIILCVQVRQKELKTQLQEIKAEKVSKWDRQLSACKEALMQLEICEKSFGSVSETAILNSNLESELTKELEFVDAGNVKFEVDNYQSILQNLQKFGSLTYRKESNWNEPGNSISVKPKFTFGETGVEEGKFCRPWGVCSDATGRILVCDRSNHRIQIFNECGQFMIQFGKEGAKPGEFNRPSGIEVDQKCRIIVADKDNHRIQIFTYSGHYLLGFGRQGTKPGQFMYPWDVSANSDCDIAVSDTKNHRIQLFNSKGRFITLLDAVKLGYDSPRLRLRYFDSPRGLAFRPDGCLLVTDFNNHRVILVNKEFNKISAFGREGMNNGQFFRPQGIACDSAGNFAVADSKNYRVQVFDVFGNYLKSFGCQGSQPGQFDCPQGICFHPNQNIIVVDFNNNRVQVF